MKGKERKGDMKKEKGEIWLKERGKEKRDAEEGGGADEDE